VIRRTQLIHFAHGVLAGAVFFISWVLSAFLYIQFFIYEYFEESKIKDEMYYELREWALGFACGLGVYLAFVLLNVAPAYYS
jgi:hypothetical protein